MSTLRVHSIESFATLDGAGIRCAVFFAGCPLRCLCCHNADTWTAAGAEYTPEALAEKILRFRTYFAKNGGVTWSGGEPLLQARALSELSRRMRAEGIHVALDTSGCIWNADVAELLNSVDLVIADLKRPTEEDYRTFAGGSLAGVLRFLEEVCARKLPLWLRTVVIPGINDTERDIDAYYEIARRFPAEKYELLGFHTLGFSKYEAQGLVNPLADTPAMDAGRLKELQTYLDGKYERERG